MANPVTKAVKAAVAFVLPKRQKAGGVSYTNTFNPTQTDAVLTVPTYRDHLTDIFDSRQAQDSRTLLRELFRSDPDVSAAVNAYLTSANQPLLALVKDQNDQLDLNGMQLLSQTLTMITKQNDYTLGFTLKPSLATICENMRYMLLLRGACGAEYVVDKALSPSEIRHVDMTTVEWYEPKPGQFKPWQTVQGVEIDLDIPTFFVGWFHRDPTDIYSYSPFISAINTIAARQQVINDLYRIMRITGFPRLDIKVLEEVLVDNAPADIRANKAAMKTYLNARLQEVATTIQTLRPDQAFVHFESVETGTMNDKMPGVAIDISAVIEVLNAQNQAGLKTMATIIGRGESGVNTASVEARIFSMNADELNAPIAELMSNLLTLALRIQGFQGYVECSFKKVELRPDTELEPMMAVKQQRHLELLSHGLIDDQEFHMTMFGRPKPESAPELSGTGFFNPPPASKVDPGAASPNADPLGRAISPSGSKVGRSNTVKPKSKAAISSKPK